MKKRIIAIVLSLILCFSFAVPAFAADEEDAAKDSGFSFDISIEDILNSDIVLGILASDGFMDITNIVIELMAMFNEDSIKAMTQEQLTLAVQSVFDAVAGAISQIYGNKDLLIKYDPLDVLRNLLGLGDDFLQTSPDDDNTKNPNELVIGPGDVDGDGRVTAADARLILRRAALLITFTMEQDDLADVDRDGKVTAKDARLVLKYVAGLFTEDDYNNTSFVFQGTIG